MWLLNTLTYKLHFEQHPSRVVYAILSHVWDHAGHEQTFEDLQAIHAPARRSFTRVPEDDNQELLAIIRVQLSAKIVRCCQYANSKGFAFVWIDTCCIDKTSSAELSEAINSMFDWYSFATVCYVYLADVPDSTSPRSEGSWFRSSAWFSRGWTLQELIVPHRNIFLSQDWRMIGTKATLADVIETITGIDVDVLRRTRPLLAVSVARRMSWAAHRYTTRIEDEAYCLMGIFGVRFPTVYGEGRQAFVRLQEEIMKRLPDYSHLAWGYMWPLKSLEDDLTTLKKVPMDELRASKGAYLFASRPTDFQWSAGFSPIPLNTLASRLGVPSLDPPNIKLGILACEDAEGRIPALIIYPDDSSSTCLIGGFEPLHSYFYKFDGTISPLQQSEHEAFNASLDEEGSVSRRPRSITRLEWMLNARAEDVRHAPMSLRIVLLEPSALRAVLAKHPESLAIRDVYIPIQRLHVESQTSVLNRPTIEPSEASKFTAPCSIILPCWTLAHFEDLGVTYHIDTEGGETVPVSVPGPPPDDSPYRLLLRYGSSAIVVTIFQCPQVTDYSRPLHVSISSDEDQSSPDGGISKIARGDCENEHVDGWSLSLKHFQSEKDGTLDVTLQFGVWDIDPLSFKPDSFQLYPDEACYSLEVQIEHHPSEPTTATVPPGRASEWLTRIMQRR
ncbi:heterokaryon incompatibility protein-domain-containing protein [Cubamyces lactineus]|nr:heterokaryon incompatibility protein-domain-containing protein [Cubamyces lactineus]